MTSRAIAQHARTMAGTPFMHQGRVPGTGLDCAGIIWCAHRMAGIKIPDTRAYPIPCRPGQILKLLGNAGFVEVDLDDLKPGDVLVFWISRPDRPRHMALFLGGYEMMSTDAGQKASVRPLTSALRDRIHSAHRWSQSQQQAS